MTTPELVGLLLGSAAVGALASSIMNGLFNWWTKRQELEREDMQMALKMAELHHQQLIATRQWDIRFGHPTSGYFWDPFVTVIEYRRAMTEYRRTGRWTKGEALRPP